MTRQELLREQAERANYEAIEGGKDGAIRWFSGGFILFGTAQLVWPLYRRLTTPFKVCSVYPPLLICRLFCYAQVKLCPKTYTLTAVTATGAVINAERRCVVVWVGALNFRMLEYEQRIREEDRMRKRQMYFVTHPDGSANRRL